MARATRQELLEQINLIETEISSIDTGETANTDTFYTRFESLSNLCSSGTNNYTQYERSKIQINIIKKAIGLRPYSSFILDFHNS